MFDPLHIPPDFAMPEGSHHEAGQDHGYGQLVGGTADYSLVMQSLYAHTTDRNPLVGAPNHAHINNLHYNHGRGYIGRGEALNIDDNGEHNADEGRTMQCNCVGCVTVQGTGARRITHARERDGRDARLLRARREQQLLRLAEP